MDFAVLADHRVELKESEKKDEYKEFAREPPPKKKKLWSMKVTVILIVIGVLGTISKVLLKRLAALDIREQEKTINTATLLRSARMLGRVLEIWGDILSLKLQGKPSAYSGDENSQKSKIISKKNTLKSTEFLSLEFFLKTCSFKYAVTCCWSVYF